MQWCKKDLDPLQVLNSKSYLSKSNILMYKKYVNAEAGQGATSFISYTVR